MSLSRYLCTAIMLRIGYGELDASLTIEDELACSTERIGDFDKKGSGFGWECLSGCPAATGEKEEVLGASGTDGVDSLLNGVNPG